jgi:hypothetical protein
MKIVVITDGGLAARRLSWSFHSNSIDSTFLEVSPARARQRATSRLGDTWRWLRTGLASRAALRRLVHWRRPAAAIGMRFVGPCNGPEMLESLHAVKADLGIVMGAGILNADGISSCRIGVLNAHPALLPWVRGVDVLRASVMRGVPLGVTLHWIDSGIDTGPVLERWLLPVNEGDTTSTLSERADRLAVAVLTRAVSAFATGDWPPVPRIEAAETARSPLCRRMGRAEADEMDELIRRGAAWRLPASEWVSRYGLGDGATLLESHRAARQEAPES